MAARPWATGARTWPADWEGRKAGRDCPLCSEGRPEVNSFGTRRVWEGIYTDAYLRRAVAPRGYTFVIWRGRHVSEPTELAADEASGFWLEVLHVARGIERRYSPAKLNVQILGNAVPHLHAHIVPRYLDDPDPGDPPAFVEGVHEELTPEEYDIDADALTAAIAGA